MEYCIKMKNLPETKKNLLLIWLKTTLVFSSKLKSIFYGVATIKVINKLIIPNRLQKSIEMLKGETTVSEVQSFKIFTVFEQFYQSIILQLTRYIPEYWQEKIFNLFNQKIIRKQ